LVQHGEDKNFATLLPEFIWKHKSDILNAEGLVQLYQGKETYADVVGLGGLKEVLSDLLKPDEYDPDNYEMRCKGVALVGPPRTGKSLIAKALGNETGRPTLMVDLGAWFGGFVGDTEAKTRRGFQIIRAHAPCVAVIDEVEKVMPSAKGGDGDSGVSRRMAGAFMTQLQDIKEDIFWVFSANGVEDLHEAFLADDRVDCVIYVHMPGAEQRAAGWKMYLSKYFPQEINGKTFPRYLETDFKALFRTFKESSNINIGTWANRFHAAFLCLTGDNLTKAMERLHEANENVCATLKEMQFSDDNWTIARIKSVCRLARKRKKSLSQIAKMMPRKASTKLEKAISRLERWAEDEAIDAETGEAYQAARDDETCAATDRVKATSDSKVRRRVRKLDP
jgi:SpoVK/Ycf46/Vps4 family AAA+-type ATPase